MDKFEAINERMGELDGVILEHEIKLRDLKLERTTYENAKTLIIFGSLDDEKTEDINEDIGPDTVGPAPEIENPFQKGGMLFKVTNMLIKTEKRAYKIAEIADLMNFNLDQARLLGVNLSGTNRKKIGFFRIDYDIDGVYQRGVYALTQFKDLIKLHPKNLKDQKTKSKKGKSPKKEDLTENPFKRGSNVHNAYKLIWDSRRKMSIQELMTNLKLPDDERKNFGNKMALAGTDGKGVMRVGVGFYGIVIHKHLYDI